MGACLETGTHYMDMAAAGPRNVVGTADLDEEFALDDDWVNLLLTWRNLGFDHNQEIELGDARFRPLDLLVSCLPKSIDLIGKLHGHTCVGTLAEGSLGGKPVRRFMYQTTSHDEAFAKHEVQGTGWQTGVPAACAAIMFAQGLIHQRGVLAPECIDPYPFLELMTQHEMPWKVIDLPLAD